MALSQVIGKPATQVWLAPPEDYPAIRAERGAAEERRGQRRRPRPFWRFSSATKRVAVIKAAGYTLE